MSHINQIQEIRERARKQITEGAVTADYQLDRKQVISILNEALATEIVCVLRYRRHHFMATGIASESVKAEFLAHAIEEQQHADWIAERITQLDGAPNFNPEGLAKRSHAEYDESTDLHAMIRADLLAERIAIESYSDIVRWLGNDDPTTRRMIEDILKMEEEHANDMADLLPQVAKA
jgi:bacterioferritin